MITPAAGAATDVNQGGDTEGALQVSERGSATYTIPIKVAPGTVGHEPKLALRYDSSSAQNGPLGLGFSLAGLSSITRCGKTLDRYEERTGVSFTTKDRLCLDGEPLLTETGVNTDAAYWPAGMRYRTEEESWRYITGVGDCKTTACAFSVRSPDGSTSTYGTGNAIEEGEGGQAAAWLVSKIEDRNGNVMTFDYVIDGHVTYPESIDYAGRSVVFTWALRSDKRDIESSLSPSFVRQQRMRLVAVESKVGSSTFKRYGLTYGLSAASRRSRIERVTECDGNGACLAPIELEWNDSARDGRFGVVPIPSPNPGFPWLDHADMIHVTGDFNGDGLTELMTQPLMYWLPVMFRSTGRDLIGLPVVDYTIQYGDDLNSGPGARLIPGDYDGDGITDLVRQEQGGWDNDESHTFRVYFGAPSQKFSIHEPASSSVQNDTKGDKCLLIPADVDGDGRTDLLRQERSNWDDDLKASFQVWISQGNGEFTRRTPGSSTSGDPFQDFLRYDPGTRIMPGDFNGDGRTDFLGLDRGDRATDLTNNLRVYLSHGDGTFTVVTPGGEGYQRTMVGERVNLILGDFNGDGKTDFLRQERDIWDDDDLNTFQVHLSRGDGSFQVLAQAQTGITRDLAYDKGIELIPGDFNGDGKTDFIGQEREQWAKADTFGSFTIFYANGDGSFDAVAPSGADYQDLLRGNRPDTPETQGARLELGDFDGDGRTDFLRSFAGKAAEAGPVSTAMYYSDPTLAPPDHTLKAVRSGNGLEERLAYAPLSRQAADPTSAYDPGPVAAGTRELRAPLWVVAQLDRQAAGGASTVLATRYRYTGATFDRTGLGFLGFTEVQIASPAQDLVRFQFYKADPTFRGRLEREETRRGSSNQILSERRLEWQQIEPLLLAGTRMTRLVSERTIDYEGATAVEKRNEFRYDSIGNAVLQIDAGFDGIPAYTCRSYSYDPASWGQPRSIEVSTVCAVSLNACACSGERLSRSEFSYDIEGNVVQRKMFDSEHERFLVETFEYDNAGNQTVAVDPAGVREVTSYETVLRTYPDRQVVDPNGKALETRFTFDARFGTVSERTDPSGATAVQTLDTFGRLIKSSVRGGGEPETTLETRRYLQEGPLRVVEISHPEAGEATRTTRLYTDYLGRKVREEQEAADGQMIVKELEWTLTGELHRESEAHFAGETARWITYAYDAKARAVRVDAPNGLSTQLAYSVGGAECAPREVRIQITKTAATSGVGTARSRVECRNHRGDATRKVFLHDGGKSEQRLEYDLLGRIQATWVRDGAGNAVGSRTEYTYDTLGRRAATLHSQRGLTIFTHGLDGRLAEIETPAGMVTRQYDSAGRVTSEIYSDGSEDRTTYDGPAVAHAKGRMTRLTKVLPEGQLGAVRDFAYDRRGRVATETVTVDGRSFTMGYRYHANDDRAEVTYPDGSALTFAYDVAGNLERLELDGVDYASYGGHTAKGQPADVQYGNGVTTHYAYDPSGRLGHVRTLGRDDDGAAKPLMDRQYEWSAFDEIGAITDSLEPGHSETFTYDKRGFLTQAIGPYGTLGYAYDAAGNLVQKGAAAFTYDGDRPVASSTGDVFRYDERGNRTQKIAAAETIHYGYSLRDELTEVRGERRASSCPPVVGGAPPPPCDAVEEETLGVYEYDAAGARVKKTDRGGVVTLYVSPLYEVTLYPGGAELHTRYIPGAGGRIAAITEEVAPETASAPSGAVAGTALGGMLPASQAFDPRLITLGLGLALALVFVWFWIRAADRRHLVGRARHGVLRALGWCRIIDGDTMERASYAEGTAFLLRHRRRAWGVLAGAAYLMVTIAGCGQPSAGDARGAEPRAALLVGDHGAGSPVAGTHFFHLDHLGSSTLVTDALGRELSLNVYKPYGELDESSSRGPDVYRSKFVGKEWDDGADLYFFEGRHYDPATGRFMQADTLAFGSDGSVATDLNRYAYAGNNPVVYSDPSGRFFLMGLLIAVVVSAVMNVAMEAMVAAAEHRAFTWKDAGIAFGIGAATGLIGYGAGAAVTGGLVKAGAAIAEGSMTALAVEGTVGGFASGFAGDLMEQAADGTHIRDWNWANAAKAGGIGAAVGGVGDPAAGAASRRLAPHAKAFVRGRAQSALKKQADQQWDRKYWSFGVEVLFPQKGREMGSFTRRLDWRLAGALADPQHADKFGFSLPLIIRVSDGAAMPRIMRNGHLFARMMREGRKELIPDPDDED